MFSIPINPDQLTTEFSPLEEGIVYEVTVVKFSNKDKTGADLEDKNGNLFMKAEYEIVAPETYRGKHIFDNYIRIPDEILDTDDDGSRAAKRDSGVRIARIIRAFDLDVSAGKFEADKYVGSIGKLTIKNEDYEGRPMSRVKDYIY